MTIYINIVQMYVIMSLYKYISGESTWIQQKCDHMNTTQNIYMKKNQWPTFYFTYFNNEINTEWGKKICRETESGKYSGS